MSFFPENFVPFAPTLAHMPLCPCVAPRVGDTDSLGLPTFDFSPLHWDPLVL